MAINLLHQIYMELHIILNIHLILFKQLTSNVIMKNMYIFSYFMIILIL